MKRYNQHTEQYQDEKQTARQKKLTNKFKIKSFSNEYRFLYYLIFGAAILFQGASLLTALTLPASWIHKIFYSWPLAFMIVFLFMLLLEVIKRFVASRAIKNGLQFSKWFSFGIFATVVLSAASIFSSTYGTPILIKEFGALPATIDTSGMALIQQNQQASILGFWSPKIKKAEKGAKDTHNENSWKGKTTRSARPVVLEFKAKAQGYQDSLTNALVLSQNEHSNKLIGIDKENKGILNRDKIDKASTGYILGFITFGLELLFLLCTFWIEYYDYREALELSKSESKSGKSAVKVPKSEQKQHESKSAIGFLTRKSEGNISRNTIAYMKVDGSLKYYTSAKLTSMITEARSKGKEERALKFEDLQKQLKKALT